MPSIVNEQLEVLKYWVDERNTILSRKLQGMPKSWTDDPILQQFKFCNVRREDDRVTEWFKENWRNEKYWDEPNFIAAIILGRTINWPYTLARIGFPHVFDPNALVAEMDQIQAENKKVYTGAYMITAGPMGVKKNTWVISNAQSYFDHPLKVDPTSIQRSWENLIKIGRAHV